MKSCEGGEYWDFKLLRRVVCRREAVTKRKTWRWGEKGEPGTVALFVPLCTRCAELWDESTREVQAEARGA